MKKEIVCLDGSHVRVIVGPGVKFDDQRAIRLEAWDSGYARLSPSDARQLAAALLNAAAAIDKQDPDGSAVES